MKQNYSYSQPSSSEDCDIDITSLLLAEADIYADETESSQNLAEPFRYPPEPEAGDGISRSYCGSEPYIATYYTSKDPCKRYYTCANADDGDCHVWKWWDVAVVEEMSDFERQVREVREQRNESDQKVVKLEETVWELAKKKSGIRDGVPLVMRVAVSVFVLICIVVLFKWVQEKDNVISECLEEKQTLKKRISDL